MNDKSGIGKLTLKTASISSEGGIVIGGDGDYRYALVMESGAWKMNSVY